MRAFDRDLIRGGHYGQRSCEPHAKAEHMAAPTNAAFVKKALANSEPSTHGPMWTRRRSSQCRLLALRGHPSHASRLPADVASQLCAYSFDLMQACHHCQPLGEILT